MFGRLGHRQRSEKQWKTSRRNQKMFSPGIKKGLDEFPPAFSFSVVYLIGAHMGAATSAAMRQVRSPHRSGSTPEDPPSRRPSLNFCSIFGNPPTSAPHTARTAPHRRPDCRRLAVDDEVNPGGNCTANRAIAAKTALPRFPLATDAAPSRLVTRLQRNSLCESRQTSGR